MDMSSLWTNKVTWITVCWLERTKTMHDELVEAAKHYDYEVKAFAEYLHDYVEEARPEYKVGYEGWGLYQELNSELIKNLINWEEIANYYFESLDLQMYIENMEANQ